MNICDAPNQVSIGQNWREGDYVKRIPIIVTGNDFSKVFAPLVRDGRMSKFYWKPEKDELMAILHQMYKVRISKAEFFFFSVLQFQASEYLIQYVSYLVYEAPCKILEQSSC